jgi:hypothetical protein
VKKRKAKGPPVEVRGPGVYRGGQKVATLEPGSRRPLLARDNWRVRGLDGRELGYVKRPFMRLKWTAGMMRGRFATMERALEALLDQQAGYALARMREEARRQEAAAAGPAGAIREPIQEAISGEGGPGAQAEGRPGDGGG